MKGNIANMIIDVNLLGKKLQNNPMSLQIDQLAE